MTVCLFLCTFSRIKRIISCPYFLNSPHILLNECWIFVLNNFQKFLFCNRQNMMLANLWSNRLCCPSHSNHGRTVRGILCTQILHSIMLSRKIHTPFPMVSWMVGATPLMMPVIVRVKVTELETYCLYDITSYF